MANIIELKNHPQARKIRSQIKKFGSILIHLPLWITRMICDSKVPKNARARLIFCSAYIVLPISLISKRKWGWLGYIDDLILALNTLKFVFNEVPPKIIKGHWRGTDEELTLLKDWVVFLEDLPNQIPSLFKEFRRSF